MSALDTCWRSLLTLHGDFDEYFAGPLPSPRTLFLGVLIRTALRQLDALVRPQVGNIIANKGSVRRCGTQSTWELTAFKRIPAQ